jgi:hypothetical protein
MYGKTSVELCLHANPDRWRELPSGLRYDARRHLVLIDHRHAVVHLRHQRHQQRKLLDF